MIAVDTNVLVRFLVTDSPRQASVARSVFAANKVVVTHTVLLETEWVLRKSFGFGRDDIAAAFLRLLGLAAVSVALRSAVLDAVIAFRGGSDFADALHLATAGEGVTDFLTFDKSFASHTFPVGLPPVTLLNSAT